MCSQPTNLCVLVSQKARLLQGIIACGITLVVKCLLWVLILRISNDALDVIIAI